MKTTVTATVAGILLLQVLPLEKTHAQNYNYNHHRDELSTTEKVVAGALVAGIAVAAASEAQNNPYYPPAPQAVPPRQRPPRGRELSSQRDTRIVYIQDSRGSVPIYLQPAKGGGWFGPRNEYYAALPTPYELAATYGVYRAPRQQARRR
jgi:hypothetical protein